MTENQNSLNAAMCDVDGTMWVEKGFSFWAFHFYISKFYEFLDTWIIILKGKKVSFLQEFHHAGNHRQYHITIANNNDSIYIRNRKYS